MPITINGPSQTSYPLSSTARSGIPLSMGGLIQFGSNDKLPSPYIYTDDFQVALTSGVYVHDDRLNNQNAFAMAQSTMSTTNKVLDTGFAGLGVFGHPDWDDATVRVRLLFNPLNGPGPNPGIYWHYSPTRTTLTNDPLLSYAVAFLSPGGLGIWKSINGVVTTGLAGGGPAPTNNTWYWLEFGSVGTLYTATTYADVNGVQGSVIFTCSATITDPQIIRGSAGLGNVNTFNQSPRYGAALLSDDMEVAGSTQTLWRSMGTDAKGNLNSWALDVGSAGSSAANVISLLVNSQYKGGHADWGDCTFTQRFIFATGNQHVFNLHRVSSTNKVWFQIGATPNLWKQVAGTNTSLGNTGAVTFVNATAYWIRLAASGTTITAKVFADAAGALGAQMGATVTATVSDAAIQNGTVGIEAIGGTCQFGGAFASVSTVTGPAPADWTVSGSTTSVEPAFCYSGVSPFNGSLSLSIYCATTSDYGFWYRTATTTYSNSVWNISYYAKSPGTENVYIDDPGNDNTTFSSAGAWTQRQFNFTPAAGSYRIYLRTGSSSPTSTVGTYYFDAFTVSLVNPTTPFILVYCNMPTNALPYNGSGAGADCASYAWSAIAPLAPSQRSLSIFHPTVNAWGFFQAGWTVVPNVPTTASMYIKGPAGGSAGSGSLCAFGGIPDIGTFLSPAINPFTGDWQYLSFTFTPGGVDQELTNMRMQASNNSGLTAGTYYFQ